MEALKKLSLLQIAGIIAGALILNKVLKSKIMVTAAVPNGGGVATPVFQPELNVNIDFNGDKPVEVETPFNTVVKTDFDVPYTDNFFTK